MNSRQGSKVGLSVAIAGASCTGKSLITNYLRRQFCSDKVVFVDMDGYHRHDRLQRLALHEFPDDVDANNLRTLVNDLHCLRAGNAIHMPVYNHKTGKFINPRFIKAGRILFLQGLHALLINDLAREKLIDISIFLDPEEKLRNAWKVKRDITQRGYSFNQAIRQIREREPYVRDIILSQRSNADIIISITQESFRAQPKHEVFLSLTFISRKWHGHRITEILGPYCSWERQTREQEIVFKIVSIHRKNLVHDLEKFSEYTTKKAVQLFSTKIPISGSRSEMYYFVSGLLWALSLNKLGGRQ
jgi:uridine kinase